MKCYVDKSHKNWNEKIAQLPFAYNTSIHESTRYTPYEIVFGREHRDLFDPQVESIEITPKSYVEQLVKTQKVLNNLVKLNLENARERQTKYKTVDGGKGVTCVA